MSYHNCQETLTFIYSSHSKEALKDLIKALQSTFSIQEELEDMFYYGIYCNIDVYANYNHWDMCPYPFPDVLSKGSPKERKEWVEGVMDNVLRGVYEKPKWMLFVEENASVNQFNDSPSTFLVLYPKEERFKKFGEALTNFLYSPNLMRTIYNF